MDCTYLDACMRGCLVVQKSLRPSCKIHQILFMEDRSTSRPMLGLEETETIKYTQLHCFTEILMYNKYCTLLLRYTAQSMVDKLT